jgi:hypothetical protein
VTRRGLGGLVALGLLAACDQTEEEPVVRLPLGLVEGATDPRRWAISQALALLLDRPGSLAGKPAEAARGAALVEYLATAFQDGRYQDGARITRLLREGRTALRAELGLNPEAAPQAMADALFAAAREGAGPPLATLAVPGAAPWAALGSLAPPAPLLRALRVLRDTQQPDYLPT